MKIFLACTTFFGQFSKNPPALSIPPAHFSKSISIPPAHFFKCNNFLIATSNMKRSWLSPSNLSLGSPINSCRNQPKLPGDVLRMCDQILWKFGAGVIFFLAARGGGMWKTQFFNCKLVEYQHGHYYQPPVNLIETLWKFLEIFSGSMTKDSEGLEWVRIFFLEPGVMECEKAGFLAWIWGNTNTVVTTRYQ